MSCWYIGHIYTFTPCDFVPNLNSMISVGEAVVWPILCVAYIDLSKGLLEENFVPQPDKKIFGNGIINKDLIGIT